MIGIIIIIFETRYNYEKQKKKSNIMSFLFLIFSYDVDSYDISSVFFFRIMHSYESLHFHSITMSSDNVVSFGDDALDRLQRSLIGAEILLGNGAEILKPAIYVHLLFIRQTETRHLS